MNAPRPSSPTAVTVLAFDFGTRRIGVAVGNTLTGSAQPLATLDDPATEPRFAAIAALVSEVACLTASQRVSPLRSHSNRL